MFGIKKSVVFFFFVAPRKEGGGGGGGGRWCEEEKGWKRDIVGELGVIQGGWVDEKDETASGLVWRVPMLV